MVIFFGENVYCAYDLFNSLDDLPDYNEEDDQEEEENNEIFIGQEFVFKRTEKKRFLDENPGIELKACRPVRQKGNNRTCGFKVINAIQLPRNLNEKKHSTDRDKWTQAEEDEMRAMRDKNVFTEVPRPTDKQILPLNWVYRIKYNTDGSIDNYKVRLVVSGNLQKKSNQDTSSVK